MRKNCKDCFKELSPNNKSGFCRACFARRKMPKLENAQEVKDLLEEINSSNFKADVKRMR